MDCLLNVSALFSPTFIKLDSQHSFVPVAPSQRLYPLKPQLYPLIIPQDILQSPRCLLLRPGPVCESLQRVLWLEYLVEFYAAFSRAKGPG